MLGIGMQEILIILVVALIVIGPKRLPELARTLGKGFAEFRKAADDLQETVRMDLQKEQTEEFRKKYPDLVPDEDEAGSESQPESEPASSFAEASEDKTADETEDKPEPEGDTVTATDTETRPEPEPEPSYDPQEIEGGEDTEDDTRDG